MILLSISLLYAISLDVSCDWSESQRAARQASRRARPAAEARLSNLWAPGQAPAAPRRRSSRPWTHKPGALRGLGGDWARMGLVGDSPGTRRGFEGDSEATRRQSRAKFTQRTIQRPAVVSRYDSRSGAARQVSRWRTARVRIRAPARNALRDGVLRDYE